MILINFNGMDYREQSLSDALSQYMDKVAVQYQITLQGEHYNSYATPPPTKPCRSFERIFEAVYHFKLYMYLMQFLQSYDSRVTPEFPTGNGKLDLLIDHAGRIYGLEVKSFSINVNIRSRWVRRRAMRRN